MRIIPENTKIPFMSYRGIGYVVSLILIVLSLIVWFIRGESKYGLDFLGGAEVVVKFDKPLETGQIRKALSTAGISDAVVQKFGSGAGAAVFSQGGLSDSSGQEFSIRIKKSSEEGTAEDAKSERKFGELLKVSKAAVSSYLKKTVLELLSENKFE